MIPIIVRDAAWDLTPLAELQTLPKDAKPIAEWDHPARAWTDITRGIQRVAQELRPHLPPEAPSSP